MDHWSKSVMVGARNELYVTAFDYPSGGRGMFGMLTTQIYGVKVEEVIHMTDGEMDEVSPRVMFSLPWQKVKRGQKGITIFYDMERGETFVE